jgi:hypothetical protein
MYISEILLFVACLWLNVESWDYLCLYFVYLQWIFLYKNEIGADKYVVYGRRCKTRLVKNPRAPLLTTPP